MSSTPRLFALLLCGDTKKFLLVRRIACSFGQGLYSLPGGKIEPGESATCAVVREGAEELGITIDPADLIPLHTLYRQAERDLIVAFTFQVPGWSGDLINNEPTKHADFIWASLDNLPSDLLPGHRCILEALKQGVCFSEHGW